MRLAVFVAAIGLLAAGASAATSRVRSPFAVVRWSVLRRPLQLPVVAPGSPCPVSRVDRHVAPVRFPGGPGIGPGPVYPGLGATSGLLDAVKDTQFGSSWQGQKVFWYIARSYRGRVLIRGKR